MSTLGTIILRVCIAIAGLALVYYVANATGATISALAGSLGSIR